MKYLIILFVFLSHFVYGQYNVAQPQKIDVDAESYRSRLASAGYTLTKAELNAVNRLTIELKRIGVWTKLREVILKHGTTNAHWFVKYKFISAATGTLLYGQAINSGQSPQSLGSVVGISIYDVAATNSAGGAPTDISLSGNFSEEMFGFTGTGGGLFHGLIYGYDGSGSNLSYLRFGWGGATNVVDIGKIRGFFEGFYYGNRKSDTYTGLYLNGELLSSKTTNSPYSVTQANPIGFRLNTSPFQSIDDGTLTDQQIKDFYYVVQNYVYAVGSASIRVNNQNCYNYMTYGQSLSVGTSSVPALSTTQSYNNKNYSTYFTSSSNFFPALQPCTEVYQLPSLAATETPWSSSLNKLSELHRSETPSATNRDGIYTINGVSGAPYSDLAKGAGTGYYNNFLTRLQLVQRLYPLYYSGAHIVPVIPFVHGESDWNSNTYQADITQLQSDLETDIKAVTGQAGIIPIIHSQHSTWTCFTLGNSTTSKSPYAILSATEALPLKHILACAKYFLPYVADGLHLSNTSSRLLGEYYGKAIYFTYFKNLVAGTYTGLKSDGTSLASTDVWQPLKPISASISANVITATFNTPFGTTGGLVFDVTNVTDPNNKKGFEVFVNGVSTTITSVAISGTNQVIITLPSTPTGTIEIAYAYTGTATTNGGPTTGPRGNLKMVSMIGASYDNAVKLDDWCIHFKKTLPF